MKKFILAMALSLLAGQLSLNSATLPTGFTETQVGANVGTSPTALEIAPDGRIFVCLQGGQLEVIKNGVLLPTPFVALSVNSSGERGLLGIAFDPNFVTNNFVYVYYTTSTLPFHNRISRFTANGDVAVPGSEFVLVDLDNLSTATNHNGGGIHFGSDGKLYVAVGENANPANAQSIGNRLGKMLRINADGTIPDDNPSTFPGISGSTTGPNRAIWSVGLRNPFTFAFQTGTGRMFINDVGQSTWEEIDDGIAGSNYGWSICEGLCSPPNPNYRDPLYEYNHSVGDPTGCAIVGGSFYNPAVNQFPSSYIGKYFFADLCTGFIRVMDPSNNSSSPFATGVSLPVDLKVGSDGSLYYLAQGNGGQVFKVRFPGTLFLQSAVSRKTHNAAGAFDVSLPGIESRSGGATNDYQMVVTFTGNGPITVNGNPQAQVTSGVAQVGSGGVPNGGAVTVSGLTVSVPLTNVTNAQTITVTLNSVNDGTTTSNFTIPMSVLLGDTNGDAFVNAGDALQTRNRSGQATGATNFRSDVNTDGSVNSGDSLIVRSQSGTFLP